MTQVSPHFSLAELTFTQVRGLNNTPSLGEAANLAILCVQLLEPVREKFGPLIITSGYRSPEVNAAVGGSLSSMHTKGCAADFVPRRPVPLSDIVDWVAASELEYDQVILERPGPGSGWIHLGMRPGSMEQRHQALMVFEPGVYEVWNSNDARISPLRTHERTS